MSKRIGIFLSLACLPISPLAHVSDGFISKAGGMLQYGFRGKGRRHLVENGFFLIRYGGGEA